MRSSPTIAFFNYLNLCYFSGRRCKFFVALQAAVFEICACWANRTRDLRGECSNLVLISSSVSSVSTAFCLVYSLSKKDPVERTFSTNLKSVDEAAIQTPGYLRRNLLLHDL
jgi:hypothetical protein